MKITFQNPTKGPLITVSLDDTEVNAATSAYAFVATSRVTSGALTTLRTVAQTGQLASGTAGSGGVGASGGAGFAGITGPLALLGMLFAAGDSPEHSPLTPNQLRCLANPYDMSFACAAERMGTSVGVDSHPESSTELNRFRASSGIPTNTLGSHVTAVEAPRDVTLTTMAAATPTHDSIAAILKGYPSAVGPRDMGWDYDLPLVATGETRYPRLEALVDHLVGHNPAPRIIERGPGNFAALAVSIARRYPITLIENLSDVRPNLDGVSPEILAKIRLVDVKDAPKTPTADLAIWIHPIPYLMTSNDSFNGILDLAFMGQDVMHGGYLIIQTEVQRYRMPPNPDWELVYGDMNHGFLAPSHFVNYPGHTIVLRRTATALPTEWYALAEAHGGTFDFRAEQTIHGFEDKLAARIARGDTAGAISTWYQRTVLPTVETIFSASKILLSQKPSTRNRALVQTLEPWATTIPTLLFSLKPDTGWKGLHQALGRHAQYLPDFLMSGGTERINQFLRSLGDE